MKSLIFSIFTAFLAAMVSAAAMGNEPPPFAAPEGAEIRFLESNPRVDRESYLRLKRSAGDDLETPPEGAGIRFLENNPRVDRESYLRLKRSAGDEPNAPPEGAEIRFLESNPRIDRESYLRLKRSTGREVLTNPVPPPGHVLVECDADNLEGCVDGYVCLCEDGIWANREAKVKSIPESEFQHQYTLALLCRELKDYVGGELPTCE